MQVQVLAQKECSGSRWWRPRWAVVACMVLCFSVLVSRRASADAYEPALTRAILAKERALDANNRENWELALRLFLEVRALRETKEAMYELGLVAAQLGQDDLAVEAYAIALELGLGAGPREKAKQFVAQHSGSMARVTVTGPAETAIFVADHWRGVLPLERPLVMFPGKVSVQARLSDGRLMQGDFELEAGSSHSIRLGFARPQPRQLPAAAPAAPPLSPEKPPDKLVEKPAAPRADIAPDEPDASTSDTMAHVLMWSGGVVSVLSAVAVPIATSKLESARRELPNVCPAPTGDSCPVAPAGQEPEAQRVVDDIATYKALRTGAWVSLGVGAALLASGLGLKLLAGGQSDSALWLSPAVGGVHVEFQRSF